MVKRLVCTVLAVLLLIGAASCFPDGVPGGIRRLV